MRRLLVPALVLAALAAPAHADVEAPEQPSRWSVAVLGGALAPVGEMRDGYQDALIAGVRIRFRAPVGAGVQLALDYSPLPRRTSASETFDTTYGTAALLPSWTFGARALRLHLAAGGGGALERTRMGETSTTTAAPVAIAQVGLELHITRGGGLVLLGGATRTFGDNAYQYGWAMAGLTLEF